MSFKEQFTDYIHELQDNICNSLEQIDGKAKFEQECSNHNLCFNGLLCS